MRNILLISIALNLLVVGSAQAFIYVPSCGYSVCRWNSDPEFKVSSVFGSDAACNWYADVEFETHTKGLLDIRCAADAWSEVLRSWIDIGIVGGQGNTLNTTDGVSTITTTTGNFCGSTTLACAVRKTFDGYVTASDIVVKYPGPVVGTQWKWLFGAAPTHVNEGPMPAFWPYGTTPPSYLAAFRQVMVHEMGHSLGLEHSGGGGLPENYVSVMNTNYGPYKVAGSGTVYGLQSQVCNNNEFCTIYQQKCQAVPLADDRAAIAGNNSSAGLYGVFGLKHHYDLAIYPAIRHFAGFVWMYPQYGGTRCRGSDVANFSFTYANQSYTTVDDIEIRLYLSTNEYVSAYDTLVNTYYIGSLPRNTESGFSTTVQIPASIPPGEYWAGAAITSTSSSYLSSPELSRRLRNNNSIVNDRPVTIIDCQ